MAVLNPSAMLIVLGGTFGAIDDRHELRQRSRASRRSYKKVVQRRAARPRRARQRARRLRREGAPRRPARARRAAREHRGPYTRKGLQLVVDGTDPDLVAEVLEAENDAMRKRHAAGAQPFEKAGGFAPTMGIIGTVFGLIHVLENLDAPETLGPSISAAFIATLLGIASANIVYLPIAEPPEAAVRRRSCTSAR